MLVPDRHLDEISGGKNCIRSATKFVATALCSFLAHRLFLGIYSEIGIVINDLSMDDESLVSLRSQRGRKMEAFCRKLDPSLVGNTPLKIGANALDIHNKIVDSIRNPSCCTDYY